MYCGHRLMYLVCYKDLVCVHHDISYVKGGLGFHYVVLICVFNMCYYSISFY